MRARRATQTAPTRFPGTLYAGDGTMLAGDGTTLAGASPEFNPELIDDLPHKVLIRAGSGKEAVTVLASSDRLWRLPESFGTPPELPMTLLTELAEVVRRGGKVAFAADSEDTYALVRDALMLLLDDSGGRA